MLRYLPMAALHDGRPYMGEVYAIEHRASAAGGSGSGEAVARRATMRAVGVTRELAGLKPLRGVAQEVCAIVAGPVHGLDADVPPCRPGGAGQGVVRGEAWLNEQFTGERLALAARAGSADGSGALLHVGTHFTLRPGHMARSWLLLGHGSRLHLDQMAGLSFAGHALVTLSACETGIGGATDANGQEVEGLNRLVLRRGGQAVLASLWRVDDRSTSALMRAFYIELRRAGPAEALQRAQQAVRSAPGGAWASAFHWAGFYVTTRRSGSGLPLNLKIQNS